jgi:chemotaxis protein MotB
MNAWPAFTDTILAFVLVLVLMMALQAGRSIRIDIDSAAIQKRQQDQRKVSELIAEQNVLYKAAISDSRNGNIQDIVFGEEIVFESGSDNLNTNGKAIFSALVRTIINQESQINTLVEIQVKGHTDNNKIQTPEFPSNWELSVMRATKVVRFLIESGLDPSRIKVSATGYGEYAPRALNDSAPNKAKNRRVELRLIYRE